MKIGLISDIHGNKTALETVLADMPETDKLVCLGDIIGYGPHPSDCVSIVRQHADIALYGNHEKYLHKPTERPNRDDIKIGIVHAENQLTQDQIDWLQTLPLQATIEDILDLAHGYPDEHNPYKYIRRNNVTDVIPHLKNSDSDALAFGHSHIQFKQDLRAIEEGTGIAFNPGSVGQPRDNNRKAAYAILETDPLSVNLHRVEYDVKETQSNIRDYGLAPFSADRLSTGS